MSLLSHPSAPALIACATPRSAEKTDTAENDTLRHRAESLQGLFGMGEELVSFVGVGEGEVGGVVVGYLGLPAGG